MAVNLALFAKKKNALPPNSVPDVPTATLRAGNVLDQYPNSPLWLHACYAIRIAFTE